MKIVQNRKIYYAISALLIVLGIAVMIINGINQKGFFNYDIQFTGGTSVEVGIEKAFDNADIAEVVNSSIGISNPQIQKINEGQSVVIKTRRLTEEEIVAVKAALVEKYELTDDVFSFVDISETISSEMRMDAFIAVIVSCIAMLIYVSLRFKDFKIGASSIIALMHDALIVLAFYAVLRLPLNNSFIAAILTVLGYSINATIIIFDRLRENKARNSKADNQELVDNSVKQTLKRSLFTSLTTLFTIGALYVFGVQSVKEFALPIIVGIICGTYSSICISGSMWYSLSKIKMKKNA